MFKSVLVTAIIVMQGGRKYGPWSIITSAMLRAPCRQDSDGDRLQFYQALQSSYRPGSLHVSNEFCLKPGKTSRNHGDQRPKRLVIGCVRCLRLVSQYLALHTVDGDQTRTTQAASECQESAGVRGNFLGFWKSFFILDWNGDAGDGILDKGSQNCAAQEARQASEQNFSVAIFLLQKVMLTPKILGDSARTPSIVTQKKTLWLANRDKNRIWTFQRTNGLKALSYQLGTESSFNNKET